jgi:hypothetical protein
MKLVIVTLSVVFLLLISSGLTACEPSIDITIRNQTNETLQIYIGVGGDVFIGEALPGGEVVWSIERIQPHYTITVRDMDGDVLYTANFTRDDLNGKKTYDVYFPPLGDFNRQ